MILLVRRNGKYKELIVTEINAKIETGLLDDDEAAELATQLRDAAYELWPQEADHD